MSFEAISWALSPACAGVRGGSAQAVLHHMAWLAVEDDQGRQLCSTSIEELAHRSGIGRNTAYRTVRQMTAENGPLELVSGGSGGQPSVYRIRIESTPRCDLSAKRSANLQSPTWSPASTHSGHQPVPIVVTSDDANEDASTHSGHQPVPIVVTSDDANEDASTHSGHQPVPIVVTSDEASQYPLWVPASTHSGHQPSKDQDIKHKTPPLTPPRGLEDDPAAAPQAASPKPVPGSYEDLFPDEPMAAYQEPPAVRRYVAFDDQTVAANTATPAPEDTLAWRAVLNPALLGLRGAADEFRDVCRCLTTYGEVRRFMGMVQDELEKAGRKTLPWSHVLALAGQIAMARKASDERRRRSRTEDASGWDFDWLTDQQREDRREVAKADKWGAIRGLEYHERRWREGQRDGDQAKCQEAQDWLLRLYAEVHQHAESLRANRAAVMSRLAARKTGGDQ